MSEKRERKEVDRLEVGAAPKESKDFVIPAGKGAELGSIGDIEQMLGKIKADHDLVRALHQLLYNAPGTKHNRKKNIRHFKGFAPNDGVGLQKRIDKVMDNKKWTVSALKDLSDLLGLEKGGDREAVVKRIFEFLEKPSGSGATKRKREDTGKKVKKASSGKGKSKKEKKEGGPKRTATSFMIFSNEKRASVKAKHPELSFTELGSKMGELWRGLKPAEKAKYEDKAKKLKEAAAKEGGGAQPKKKAKAPKKTKKAKKEEEAEEEEEEEEEEGDDDDDDGEPDEKKAKGSEEDEDEEEED